MHGLNRRNIPAVGHPRSCPLSRARLSTGRSPAVLIKSNSFFSIGFRDNKPSALHCPLVGGWLETVLKREGAGGKAREEEGGGEENMVLKGKGIIITKRGTSILTRPRG